MNDPDKIYFTKGYKYRVAAQFEVELINCPDIPFLEYGSRISMPFAYIEKRVKSLRSPVEPYSSYFLVLEKYYGWDGATWALDSKNFRKGSGSHDALLELIGLGLLPADPWKKWTDNFLITLCKRDGMWWPRRRWVYQAVSKLGDPKGSKPRKVYCAP